MKNDSFLNNSLAFWNTAKEYLHHHLPNVRKSSPNTVNAYRDALNYFIDYLEGERRQLRKNISFANFSRDRLKEYLDWMLNSKLLTPKTCNLRLTAIRSLMEYASNEHKELMPSYLSVCSLKGIKTPGGPIEFLEPTQMKVLLAAPDTSKKTERRNQMMLILMYDTAARVSELLELKVGDLHLSSDIPYVTIYGKGRKYRNIPLMNKTRQHLHRYLQEFHASPQTDSYLFYATTYGIRHRLSTDTVEILLKRYAEKSSSKVEMPTRIHCHMVRKTRAMDLYQNGVPLTHIQQLLGHENLSTTSGFYAFATLETLARSMGKDKEEASAKKWNDKETIAKIYRL